MKDERNYGLLQHNTFGIDARCRRFVEFENEEELSHILKTLTAEDEPLMILGGGSNLLLTRDYEGTVIHSGIMGAEATEEKDGTILLRCGSGEVFDDMVALAVKNGWHGMENLSLIPGEVGASAVQNIGAYGAEAKDVICTIEALEVATGEKVVINVSDCDYGYRQSRFKKEWKNRYVIAYVTYRLSREFTPNIDYGGIRTELEKSGIINPDAQQLRDCIIGIRNAKLPDTKVEGNAGSFFMNPVVSRSKYEELAALYPGMPHYNVDAEHEKIPAGWMIDQCGWKGRSMGNAGVHDRQALVLVNRGGATGEEVVRLCETIRRDVRQKFGIDIHPEVNIF